MCPNLQSSLGAETFHSSLPTCFCMQDLPAFHPPISPEERRPIRVLGLFDGIATGLVALKELGVEVTKYISSEIDTDAIFVSMVQHNEIEHVGNVSSITEKEVNQSIHALKCITLAIYGFAMLPCVD